MGFNLANDHDYLALSTNTQMENSVIRLWYSVF